MMKRFFVTLPIVGTVKVEVEAENKEAAIEAAFESPDLTVNAIYDWEALPKGCRGNVCYLPTHSASVEEIKD